MTPALYGKRLLVVAGKGGVGRTTVSAALALSASRAGKRVLLAQMRSPERLARLLGGPEARNEIGLLLPNLWAVNITPDTALREYGTMVLRSAMIERAVLENRLARAFIHAIPGVEDYSMLGKVWFHTTEEVGGRPRFDLVVVDAPATGHVLTLLQIPGAILEAVPEGPLTTSARSAYDLLRDPARSAAVLVTLAEDMPVNETLELAAGLKAKVGLALGPVVVNQLYPPRFVTGPSRRALEALPEAPAEAPGDDVLAPLLVRARIAMRRRALNDVYLEKLGASLSAPITQLPYLFAPEFGAVQLDDLSRRLEAQLAAL